MSNLVTLHPKPIQSNVVQNFFENVRSHRLQLVIGMVAIAVFALINSGSQVATDILSIGTLLLGTYFIKNSKQVLYVHHGDTIELITLKASRDNLRTYHYLLPGKQFSQLSFTKPQIKKICQIRKNPPTGMAIVSVPQESSMTGAILLKKESTQEYYGVNSIGEMFVLSPNELLMLSPLLVSQTSMPSPSIQQPNPPTQQPTHDIVQTHNLFAQGFQTTLRRGRSGQRGPILIARFTGPLRMNGHLPVRSNIEAQIALKEWLFKYEPGTESITKEIINLLWKQMQDKDLKQLCSVNKFTCMKVKDPEKDCLVAMVQSQADNKRYRFCVISEADKCFIELGRTESLSKFIFTLPQIIYMAEHRNRSEPEYAISTSIRGIFDQGVNVFKKENEYYGVNKEGQLEKIDRVAYIQIVRTLKHSV